MSDHREHACAHCGSLLHHANRCERLEALQLAAFEAENPPPFRNGRCTHCGGVERDDHDCYDPECEMCGARPQNDPDHMLINGCDQCGTCYDAHCRRTSVAFAVPLNFGINDAYGWDDGDDVAPHMRGELFASMARGDRRGFERG